jgi:transcriptional regulator with XRE-family HTH domain
MITGNQVVAARALLDWTQEHLSTVAEISRNTLANFEGGNRQPRPEIIHTIQHVLERNGIQFMPGGLRKVEKSMIVYEGTDGFNDFYDDVYQVIKNGETRDILVSNVEENKFLQARGEHAGEHAKRMKALQNKAHYKVLICEGDYHFFSSEYADYRWLPAEYYTGVPFYIYGDKLAQIIWGDEVKVFVSNFPELTDTHRKYFQMLWDLSSVPPVQNHQDKVS